MWIVEPAELILDCRKLAGNEIEMILNQVSLISQGVLDVNNLLLSLALSSEKSVQLNHDTGVNRSPADEIHG